MSLLFLVGCDSTENESILQKKLNEYFEKSSNVTIEKRDRLQYIDSAINIIDQSFGCSLHLTSYVKKSLIKYYRFQFPITIL